MSHRESAKLVTQRRQTCCRQLSFLHKPPRPLLDQCKPYSTAVLNTQTGTTVKSLFQLLTIQQYHTLQRRRNARQHLAWSDLPLPFLSKPPPDGPVQGSTLSLDVAGVVLSVLETLCFTHCCASVPHIFRRTTRHTEHRSVDTERYSSGWQ